MMSNKSGLSRSQLVAAMLSTILPELVLSFSRIRTGPMVPACQLIAMRNDVDFNYEQSTFAGRIRIFIYFSSPRIFPPAFHQMRLKAEPCFCSRPRSFQINFQSIVLLRKKHAFSAKPKLRQAWAMSCQGIRPRPTSAASLDGEMETACGLCSF